MPNEAPESHEESRPLGEHGNKDGPGAMAGADTVTTPRGPGFVEQRILVALGVGFAIFALTVIAAWNSSQDSTWSGEEQLMTGAILKDISYSIKDFEAEYKRLPPSLVELRTFEGASRVRLEDGWGRPLIYSVEGSKYRVLSYGRDGKPGGVGLDEDLSSDDPHPGSVGMTLPQFLFEMPSGGMIRVCAVTGFCAFLLSLVVIKPAGFGRTQVMEIAVKTGLIALAAVIVSVAVISLHYLSGH